MESHPAETRAVKRVCSVPHCGATNVDLKVRPHFVSTDSFAWESKANLYCSHHGVLVEQFTELVLAYGERFAMNHGPYSAHAPATGWYCHCDESARGLWWVTYTLRNLLEGSLGRFAADLYQDLEGNWPSMPDFKKGAVKFEGKALQAQTPEAMAARPKVAGPPASAEEWRRKGILSILMATGKPMSRDDWVEAAVACGWDREVVEEDLRWMHDVGLVYQPDDDVLALV